MSQVKNTRHAESHPIPDAKCGWKKQDFQVGFATNTKAYRERDGGRDVLETLVVPAVAQRRRRTNTAAAAAAAARWCRCAAAADASCALPCAIFSGFHRQVVASQGNAQGGCVRFGAVDRFVACD